MMQSVVSSELMWLKILDEVFISFLFWIYHVNLRNLKRGVIFF